MSELTTMENARLAQMEAIIDDGLKGFISVGTALKEICDEKLYRDNHESFEEYLRDRWKLSRNYAYKLISGAEIAARIDGVSNECQARELSRIPYTDQEQVMERAKEHAELAGREVTSRDIREAASEPSSMTARKTEDNAWNPENLTELWDMAIEVVDEMREVVLKLSAHPQGCWLQAHADTLSVKIRDIKKVIQHCLPSGPCPICVGGLKPKCDTCRSRGWLPKARLKLVLKSMSEG